MSTSSIGQKSTPVSLIREEFHHLLEVESLMTDIWQCELQAYEQCDAWTVGSSCGSGLENSVSSSHGGQRNRPNINGVIVDPMMFPYHNALYPLLDCYDSIKQEGDTTNPYDAISPSVAPDPLSRNRHRRSKFSPRFDPSGFHIEELEFLEGHLPNSAIAIRETLMPTNRRVDYLQYISDGRRVEPDEVVEAAQPREDDAAFSRPRFWKILMNQKTNLSSSNVSLGPDDEGTGEDDDEEVQIMAKNARDFSFLSWWENEIKSNKPLSVDLESKMPASTPILGEYSVECLFATSPDDANLLLLRVLKHAMSDLQRDFKLARAILLLIADLHLIDDKSTSQQASNDGIETLRRLLIIISSEYIYCSGSCHEWYLANGGVHNDALETNAPDDESIDLDEISNETDDERENYNTVRLNDSQHLDSLTHYCTDWFQFLGSISTVIANGIEFMTQQHITVICAFVLREIDFLVGTFYTSITDNHSKSGNDSAPEVTTCDGKPHSSRYKGYIKQNLFMFKNHSDFDEQDASSPSKTTRQLRVNLLVALVNGLKQHAFIQRMRLEKQVQDCDATFMQSNSQQLSLKQTLAAFNTCVEAVVDIGERIVFNLPANNISCLLGGTVARALLEMHLESEVVSEIDENQLYIAQNANSRLRSIIDPLRYADAISNASTNSFNTECSRKTNSDILDAGLISSYIDQPSQDAQDVVKALFIRDLVDLRISGFGWGDFSVWFRLPISPSEPHIFLVHRNFPMIDDSGEIWVTDEEGQDLDHTGISARHDFSLLLLLREWNRPWTSGSHSSYSAHFRSAVKELALCAHRFGVPSDIVASVNTFLPRTWWPDERSCCWCRDCQFLGLKEQFRSKILTRKGNWSKSNGEPFAQPQHHSNVRHKTPLQLITCKCNVALACSKDHLRSLRQEWHKRECGLPPFRALVEEDELFIREILKDGAVIVGEGNCKLNDGDDDDDWESVNSDEATFETITISQKIRRYFENNKYKYLRREALPFQDFF